MHLHANIVALNQNPSLDSFKVVKFALDSAGPHDGFHITQALRIAPFNGLPLPLNTWYASWVRAVHKDPYSVFQEVPASFGEIIKDLIILHGLSWGFWHVGNNERTTTVAGVQSNDNTTLRTSALYAASFVDLLCKNIHQCEFVDATLALLKQHSNFVCNNPSEHIGLKYWVGQNLDDALSCCLLHKLFPEDEDRVNSACALLEDHLARLKYLYKIDNVSSSNALLIPQDLV